MREYFLKSERLGFSVWREDDLDLAREALEKAGVKVLDVQHESSSLEAFYFNLVGGDNDA